MESQKRKLMLTGVVILLTFVSTFVLSIAAETYLEVAKATQGMEAKLMDVEIEGNTLWFTFHFNNESDIDINLINVQFNLYSDSTFMGNIGTRGETLLAPGSTDVLVRAEIDPYYVEKLVGHEFESIESFVVVHEIHWSIRGGAVIELPFEETTVTVRITELWVSS